MDAHLWLGNWAEMPNLLKLKAFFHQLQLGQDFTEVRLFIFCEIHNKMICIFIQSSGNGSCSVSCLH